MKERAGAITAAYKKQVLKKSLFLFLLLGTIFTVAVYAVARGAYEIPVGDVIRALLGQSEGGTRVVVLNIRLPRVAASLVCGWGLALAGLAIQSLLKNPLGSPLTLGMSHGAAFGAALGVVVFGAKGVPVPVLAFLGAMGATVVILILARLKSLSPEAVVLAGVALSALFQSANILVQYVASETQLAQAVVWTFGDVARSGWKEIGLLALVALACSLYLAFMRWDMNALASGDVTAKGLGVNVERVRAGGMLAAALMASLVTAFHGVIAFVGLIAPHMARRLVGDDHRLLIPFTAILGALLLLASDTLGRVLIGSGALPVGVITSFLGAPMFLYLLVRGHR